MFWCNVRKNFTKITEHLDSTFTCSIMSHTTADTIRISINTSSLSYLCAWSELTSITWGSATLWISIVHMGLRKCLAMKGGSFYIAELTFVAVKRARLIYDWGNIGNKRYRLLSQLRICLCSSSPDLSILIKYPCYANRYWYSSGVVFVWRKAYFW